MDVPAMLSTIPYIALHPIEPVEQERPTRVRLAFRKELENYVGTLHAGALYTLAETSAGVAAFLVVPRGAAAPILRGAAVRYLRRVEGDVEADAQIEDDDRVRAQAAFAAEGRADVSVTTTLTDTTGATVFEGAFDYALRPSEVTHG